MGHIRIVWVFLHILDGSVFILPHPLSLPGLRGQKMGPEPSEGPSSQRDFIDGRPVTWSLLPSSFKPAAPPPAEEAWRRPPGATSPTGREGLPLHGEEEDQKMGGLDGGGPGAERRRGTGRMRKLSTLPHPKAGAGGVLEGSAASQVTGGDVVGWADTGTLPGWGHSPPGSAQAAQAGVTVLLSVPLASAPYS